MQRHKATDRNSPLLRGSVLDRVKRDFRVRWQLYLMVLPVLAYYLLFHYGPLYGAQIAFRKFSFSAGILGSKWVGLENFRDFFSSIYFPRLMRNTILISLYNIIFGFPIPILLAVLLNEVRSRRFRGVIQTSIYLPHFISLVVVCSLVKDFFSASGLLTSFLSLFGLPQQNYMLNEHAYRSIYTFSTVWQEAGWNSIVFFAALSAIDTALYEAAKIDGAGRIRQILHVTLPGIAPTIIIMLIMRVGYMMDLGSEKTLLLYNASTYETADVIASYVYRKGLQEMNYSYSVAVDLFNSLINFALIILVNQASKRTTGTSLF